jgi:predicted O-methyltransferase YrrM
MDTIGGYFWAEEARQLYENTMRLPEGSLIVESGCLYGRSTSVLATVAKDKRHRLYVIDCWVVEGRDAKPKFWENMQRIGVSEIINFIEKDALEAAKDFEDESIDFIHIDSAHDYTHMVKETAAWWPKMKNGAVMAFHDYGNTVFAEEIKKAVDEVKGLIKLGVYNSLGVFKKKEEE